MKKNLLKTTLGTYIFLCRRSKCHVGNLEKIFLDVLDKHAPLQHKKIRSKKARWITNDIKNLMNTRDRFKRKAILTNNENDWLNFRTTRNKVNIKLRNAKKDYYSKKDFLKGFN